MHAVSLLRYMCMYILHYACRVRRVANITYIACTIHHSTQVSTVHMYMMSRIKPSLPSEYNKSTKVQTLCAICQCCEHETNFTPCIVTAVTHHCAIIERAPCTRLLSRALPVSAHT